MMTIRDFVKTYADDAGKIALMNYEEERSVVTILPQIGALPDLTRFADNGLGVAAFEQDRMVGFLCCYDSRKRAFNSTADGTFSPIHAHGAVKENRGMIYKRLYQAAAEKWVKHNIMYHTIALYAHDTEALGAMFSYGFGLRCIDAVRAMQTFGYPNCDGVSYEEIAKTDEIKIREMRRMLSDHLGCSPCFMYMSPQDIDEWISRSETRDSRVFIAMYEKRPVAFIEITDEGENFATAAGCMRNICGAYCMSEHRGKGIVQGLLNHVLIVLAAEGYTTLGVDFESFNPTAYGFWLKYFSAYTNSVVRRIDEGEALV